MAELTAARLRELVVYEPDSGTFRARTTRGNFPVGRVLGTKAKRGAIVIRLDYELYYAHRLAWLYMTGEWPPDGVDHRDLDATNNRWINLRPATQSQNQANRHKDRDAVHSRLRGVTFDRSRGKWIAQVVCRGRSYYLGRHATEADAHAAFCVKARELFGEYARTD